MITGKSQILLQGNVYLCLNRSTNDDGRCPGLITRQMFISGVYKIRFETAQYWESMGETCFYPYVEVRKRYVLLGSWAAILKFTAACGVTIFLWLVVNMRLHLTYHDAEKKLDYQCWSHLFIVSLQIIFTIDDPGQKYHIPLLLSRFSYSTYRGS